MKHTMLLTLALLGTATSAPGQGLDDYYQLGPDSLEQEGVPHGKMVGPLTLPCEVCLGHRAARPEAGRRHFSRHDALAVARSPRVSRRERPGRARFQPASRGG